MSLDGNPAYASAYSDNFILDRRDGVLIANLQTDNGPRPDASPPCCAT